MAMVSIITNPLKAAFLIRIARPGCEPSVPMKPPGMVMPAVKVTVAMSVSTTRGLVWYAVIDSVLSLSPLSLLGCEGHLPLVGRGDTLCLIFLSMAVEVLSLYSFG
uniref:Uncharacterized protein n=1 Tax=Fagus sylvatica TaxID=28930 RepID=A0A2N9G501_FAGSY